MYLTKDKSNSLHNLEKVFICNADRGLTLCLLKNVINLCINLELTS